MIRLEQSEEPDPMLYEDCIPSGAGTAWCCPCPEGMVRLEQREEPDGMLYEDCIPNSVGTAWCCRENCTICYNVMENPVYEFDCVHKFCIKCIDKLIARTPNAKCPMCRAQQRVDDSESEGSEAASTDDTFMDLNRVYVIQDGTARVELQRGFGGFIHTRFSRIPIVWNSNTYDYYVDILARQMT